MLHGLHARELRQEETGFIDYVFIEQVQKKHSNEETTLKNICVKCDM